MDEPIKPPETALPLHPQPQRLVSLDVFRGFVMLLMVSEGLELSHVASTYLKANPESSFWKFIDYQFSHAPWTGCSLWDLIQPSFTFIVGVAMPYSYAARQAKGDSRLGTVGHVLWRAFFLTFLGVFLRSNHRPQANFTFEDVTSQIGLGYAFVYLFLGRGWRVQAAGLAAILVGYWALFALWPQPGPEFDAAKLGIPSDWQQFTGFAAHWNKCVNPAGWFDRWFLNLWPRPVMTAPEGPIRVLFTANGGGYQTLSFIPSAATILIGVIVGEFLRGPLDLPKKIARVAAWGVACLAFGMAIDGTIWPFVNWTWTLCPIVKRIWTPSWVVFAAGWTLLLLALFLWIIDLRGWRRWAFPLLVVGMNSIAMYVMSYLTKGWVHATLKTHLWKSFFEGDWAPFREAAAVTFVLWLICWWMYRRKIFIRV